MKCSVILILTAILTFGCGGSYFPMDQESPRPTDGESKARQQSYQSEKLPSEEERMIVSNASLKIKTAEPDAVHVAMIDLATEHGGYVLKSSENMTAIRIPATEFRTVLAKAEGLGELISRNITGQDVTESYDDLQTRLNNAETTRQRYLKLLDRASTIDEILRLERELERLGNEIEMLKGKIERLGHLVAYATVEVHTVPVEPETSPGIISFAFQSVYKGVKWLFVR